MSMMNRPVIQVADMHMSYGDNHVLRGVDLTVDPGEVVVLLGPNGAGKTTTVEVLEGFRRPTAGSVQVLGEDPSAGDEAWRAQVGVVLQSWRDHGRWRVRELVQHIGEFYRPYSTVRRPRPWDVDELLTRVGLADQAGSQIVRLSGGQRRRLDVAVGLVGRPEVLFLDEPTAGFDPHARRDFHDLLRGLADQEVSVLLTTHDLDEAEKIADRILILTRGRIAENGSPDDLRRKASAMAEIRWAQDGVSHVHSTEDPAGYLRAVLNAPGGPVTDLEVRRATLEDAYLGMVGKGRQPEDTAAAAASSQALPVR